MYKNSLSSSSALSRIFLRVIVYLSPASHQHCTHDAPTTRCDIIRRQYLQSRFVGAPQPPTWESAIWIVCICTNLTRDCITRQRCLDVCSPNCHPAENEPNWLFVAQRSPFTGPAICLDRSCYAEYMQFCGMWQLSCTCPARSRTDSKSNLLVSS